MKLHLFLVFSIIFLTSDSIQAQVKKFDSTVSMGRAGYRVICGNKNLDQNDVSLKLNGFKETSGDFRFAIKGRIAGIEIDDLNTDSYPDLLIYAYTGPNGQYGTVYGFVSAENKNVIPFSLPDVLLDGKISDGYKGHDEFSLLEGTLMQKFPVYKPNDSTGKPTGGRRVVLYKVNGSQNEGYRFKMIKFYDIKD
ncbi:MAG: hypothetical protein C5B59_06280 [Bacteroidetes bacterium]|nr:MAG: hypothetical protein C5B59_06280 [Bacteroidota bacterium]